MFSTSQVRRPVSFLIAIQILVLINSHPMWAQPTSPNALVSRSLHYHDPMDLWTSKPLEIILKESRPNVDDMRTILFIDIDKQRFHLDRTVDNHRLEYKIDSQQVTFLLDGSSTLSDDTKRRYKLTTMRSKKLRDYYLYFCGLPMKLRDPGAIWDPIIEPADFQQLKTWRMKVTYEPTVGKDTWYFYFDQDDYSLRGCRFYHDESKNDGEYIVFEGVVSVGGINFPQHRHWYLNKDDTYLGSDTIE